METYDKFKNRCRELISLNKYYDNKFSCLNCYENFSDLMTFKEFLKCKGIDTSRYKKRARCFGKYFSLEILAKFTKSLMVFGTITLNDNYFKLSEENQKKVVQRYLKKHFFYIIKNKDYGDKNGRLHFHFIGLTFDKIISNGKKSKKGREMYNLENDDWHYGFAPNFEIIPYNIDDKKRLSNYLVKLNNHSNKISVKKSRLSILKNRKYLEKKDLSLSNILFD